MRRMSWVVSVTVPIVLSFACAGWSDSGGKEEPIPNELPPSWSLEEIANVTLPARGTGAVYILAWSVMENTRHFRIESCLVLCVLDKDDGKGRWRLAHLYRHPKGNVPDWQLATSHISGVEGAINVLGLWVFHEKQFNRKPSNKEIYASFSEEEVNWNFGQPEGYKFVSCAVCEKGWVAAIGEKPTQFFGR